MKFWQADAFVGDMFCFTLCKYFSLQYAKVRQLITFNCFRV